MMQQRLVAAASVAGLLLSVTATVRATWTQNGEFVWCLLIEGLFNRVQCRFEGGIAADRATVTGEARCGDSLTRFRATINRTPR